MKYANWKIELKTKMSDVVQEELTDHLCKAKIGDTSLLQTGRMRFMIIRLGDK